MKTPIDFIVDGKPQPAGSKRAFVLKGGANKGRAIVTDANPNSKDWKIDVRTTAKQHYSGEPWECPIVMELTFYLQRPKGHFGSGKNASSLRSGAPPYPVSKPDATKLCRGVEDALTGVLWVDDSQIVTQHIEKRYGKPGVHIRITEVVS